MSKPIVMERGVKYRDADKMALIPVKNVVTERDALLRKPEWMKIKLPADSTRIQGIKAAMRKNGLHSVCEEASCPNLAECFNHGTATFMILGAICTRRCPFCDVAHGRPVAPDAEEPQKLAQTIADMALRYVVITSVDRDDLRDGGAQHFADCITAIRAKSPEIKIETLVPDFRGRMDRALDILNATPPDVFKPQPGKRAAYLPPGSSGRRLQLVAEITGTLQRSAPGNSDKIGSDGGLRRNQCGNH
ncbi:lipoic acid synthetase [Salmonella enterica subsp. enterica]|nr:lipoic acid synthetase [Salmonella enterica subsp. enterica]